MQNLKKIGLILLKARIRKLSTLVLPAGSLPSWLQGTLLRNGPGLFSVGHSEYNHWFDGLSLIHSFSFRNGERSWPGSSRHAGVFICKLVAVVAGEVTYRSKFLKSETYKKNCESNRIVVSEFGTMAYPDPCKNIFSRLEKGQSKVPSVPSSH